MASNYWDSTQAKFWTFTKAELEETRAEMQKSNQILYNKFPLPNPRHLNIFIQQNLLKLSRRMSLRQQALATAQIYIKRFYLRVEIRKHNPYLIMATAVYLACKMEECPQHIRIMHSEAARQWPELVGTESSKIGECEFALISTLSSRLIIHHPYRSVSELQGTFGLTPDEIQLTFGIINDSYNTDLPMLYPPHVIAVAAMFMAVVLRPTAQPSNLSAHAHAAATNAIMAANPSLTGAVAQNALAGLFGLKQAGPKLSKMVDWLAESQVDINAVVDSTQELVSLYEVWESYNERQCKESVAKFLREGALNK